MITGSRAIPGTRQPALARALFSQIREGGVSGRVVAVVGREVVVDQLVDLRRGEPPATLRTVTQIVTDDAVLLDLRPARILTRTPATTIDVRLIFFGALAVGLRVVRDDGGASRFRQALLRGLGGGRAEGPGTERPNHRKWVPSAAEPPAGWR